jgi:hypothetical protein
VRGEDSIVQQGMRPSAAHLTLCVLQHGEMPKDEIYTGPAPGLQDYPLSLVTVEGRGRMKGPAGPVKHLEPFVYPRDPSDCSLLGISHKVMAHCPNGQGFRGK